MGERARRRRSLLNEIFHLAPPFSTSPCQPAPERWRWGEGSLLSMLWRARGSTRGKLSCHRIPHSRRRVMEREGGITEREGDRRRTEHGNEARCGCQTRAVQVQDDLVEAVLFRVAICTFERRDGLPHPSPFNSFPPPFPSSSFSTPGETANQSPLFVVLVVVVVGDVVVWTVAVGRLPVCTTE